MLSLADPAAMSLIRAQRVQAFEPDGGETAAADTRWAFMSKANVRDKKVSAEETEQRAEKPTLPWHALEAIQSAKVAGAPAKLMICACLSREGRTIQISIDLTQPRRTQGEVDVILDLVSLVRQHVRQL